VRPLKYTLVADGPSDRVLLRVLDWLICQQDMIPEGQFFDPRKMPEPPKDLAGRIHAALDLFPCTILFVHRDAELASPGNRRQEIETALQAVAHPPHVCVIPVRMTEAWFLFDETALRRAAGNPNGKTPLHLPRLQHIENQPNPKRIMTDALRQASGLGGRRLAGFETSVARYRLAELVQDFAPLRTVAAFQCLEHDLIKIVAQQTA